MTGTTTTPTLLDRAMEQRRDLEDQRARMAREDEERRRRDAETLFTDAWRRLTGEQVPPTAAIDDDSQGRDVSIGDSLYLRWYPGTGFRVARRCARCGDLVVDRAYGTIDRLVELAYAVEALPGEHGYPGCRDDLDEEGDPTPGTRFYREPRAAPTSPVRAYRAELLAAVQAAAAGLDRIASHLEHREGRA